MPILVILSLILFAAFLFGPNLWVQHIIKKHNANRPDFPGTGGELAKHLLDHFQLDNVKVEMTDQGDHYDLEERIVRLSNDHYSRKSVSAVAVAAHEVGHAIQHARGERMLHLRQTMAKTVLWTDRIGAVFFFVAPFFGLVTRTPSALIALSLLGFLMLSIRVLMHLVTLPVEFDASFKKALPILEKGNYLAHNDLLAARSVLKAAALTYVAAALMGFLNVLRFMRWGR